MVQFKKVFFSISVLGLMVASLAFAQAVSSVSLVGKLIDPEGRAVKDTGARLIAFREGELVRETIASLDGRYELPLTSGTWLLFVDVNPGIGFLPPNPKQITIPQGSGAYTWNPVLERASGIIVGSLEKEAGGKLGRVLVNIVNLVTGKLSSSEEAPEGSYGIPVSQGTYSIEAFSADSGVMNPAAERRTVGTGFADLKMVFRQSDGVITGEIGGVPLGATVSVVAWSDGGHQSEAKAESTTNGYRYSLKVRRNDVWHLRAAAAGIDGKIYESVEYAVLLGDVDTKIQNFLLFPSASPTLPGGKTGVFDGASGGTVSLSNGMLVSLPRQAGSNSDLIVSVAPSFIASPKQSIIGSVYRVSASRTGIPVQEIETGMVVGIPYTDADLARAKVKHASQLRLSLWDEVARAWRNVSHSVVDEKKKIVYGYTGYLALFGVGGGTEPGEIPSEEPTPPPPSDAPAVTSSGGGANVQIVTVQPVTAPTNLSVAATSEGFLRITWFDFVLKNGEVHDVERAVGQGVDFSVIAQAVESPYVDRTVQPGTTYRYRVVARDATGSAPSTSEIGTVPADSRAPSVTAITSVIQERNAAVSVSSTEQAIIAVRCLPSGGGSAVEALLANLVQAATIPLVGLNPGTDYACDITGTDAAGNTSLVTKMSFRTLGSEVVAQPAQPAQPTQPPPPSQQSPATQPQPTFNRNLTFGSTGADVRALQQILVSRGDLRITTTTQFFGQATRAALVTFQIRNGLPGTGFFGPQTRARINSGIYQ